MLKIKQEDDDNSLKIKYAKEPPTAMDYLQSIGIDVFFLVMSIFMIDGFKYISGILDLVIVSIFILVFSGLQLMNIKVNMNYKYPTIENLELQITSLNRAIGFIPIIYLIAGAPTIVYPYFLGAFIFSNGFNILMHLQKIQTYFFRITTQVDSDQVIIETRSKLFRMSGKWIQTIDLNSSSIFFRVKEKTKNYLGFPNAVLLSSDAYDDFTNKEPSNDTMYSLHFLKGIKLGSEIEIDDDKDDSIFFIGRTRNFDNITSIISKIQQFIEIEYHLFAHN